MSRKKTYKAPPEAIAKYREFHRYDPKSVGPMTGLRVPARMRCAGDAVCVLYRSGKVDPATLEKPKKPVNYIHEHNAGVKVYLPDGQADTDVPKAAREASALVLLGKCLGYDFRDPKYPDDDPIQAVGQDPLPELYCIPSGKVLLVVQDKRQLLAAIWGGALGVFARGIDG